MWSLIQMGWNRSGKWGMEVNQTETTSNQLKTPNTQL